MPFIEGNVVVDVCEKCGLGNCRRVVNVRTGEVTETDRCVCGGKLIRMPLAEWLEWGGIKREPLGVMRDENGNEPVMPEIPPGAEIVVADAKGYTSTLPAFVNSPFSVISAVRMGCTIADEAMGPR